MGFMSNPAGGDGNFTVYVKYNAKAGRWYTREDKQDAEDFEVTNMTAIFDMPNIRTGWFLFAAGVAPAKTFDPSLSEAAPKPGDGFKRGFEIQVYSDKNLLGLREFASTAGVVIEAMNNLYDAWEAGKASNPGKLPVVKCSGVAPVTNKHGTNYQPKFEIAGWADRPAGLLPVGITPAAAPAPVAQTAPAPEPVYVGRSPEPVDIDGDGVDF